MKKYTFIIVFLTIICSCESNHNTENDEKAQLIEEFEKEGFKYLGQAQLQYGISDTLMHGYTDRKNGVYHNKTERFKELEINGYEFEESADALFKQRLMIYSFEFHDSEEKEKFEKFQKYILNYQRHSKNKVRFYKRSQKWFLRFEPMP